MNASSNNPERFDGTGRPVPGTGPAYAGAQNAAGAGRAMDHGMTEDQVSYPDGQVPLTPATVAPQWPWYGPTPADAENAAGPAVDDGQEES